MISVEIDTAPTGRLAIWNGCVPELETQYEYWYQTEHLFERMAIPGFQRARRYVSVDHRYQYLTYYETDSPDVLTSAEYLQRVNHPTPMTTDIMRDAFTDMSRTVCQLTGLHGNMRGGYAATLKMPQLPDNSQLTELLAAASQRGFIATVECWQATDCVTTESAEARLRGGDQQIAACLIIETLHENHCRTLIEQLAEDFELPQESTGIFRLLCDLSHSTMDSAHESAVNASRGKAK